MFLCFCVLFGWVELGVCDEVFVGEEEIRFLFQKVKVFCPAVVTDEYDEVGYV